MILLLQKIFYQYTLRRYYIYRFVRRFTDASLKHSRWIDIDRFFFFFTKNSKKQASFRNFM